MKAIYKENSRLLYEETIEALRNKDPKSTYMERLLLADEAYELYRELPQPLYLGKGLYHMLEHVSCPVEAHDILLGRVVEYVPGEEEERILEGIQKRFYDQQYFMKDNGHITLDWETVLEIGISGYVERARKALEKRKIAGDSPEKITFLEGMLWIYQAFRRYIERYAEAAEKWIGTAGVASEKREGIRKAAEASRNLVNNPPQTFYEGMQLILYITHAYSVYAARSNATLTCGRMDDLLADLYEKDLAAGRITPEEAGCIIDDFNCKCAIILGRGEHQMSAGDPDAVKRETGWFRNPMYDSPTYVIIGGKSGRRDHRTNPLTLLFAKHIHPRLENPVYVFRRTEEDNPEVWTAVCDKLRQNASLLIYNDETVIPAMEESGVEACDAVNYTIHGCNWPDIPGKYAQVHQVGIPMPTLIMEAMFEENGMLRQQFAGMEALYEAIEKKWTGIVRKACEDYRRLYGTSAEQRNMDGEPLSIPVFDNILYCTDCFTEGPLEAAATYRKGNVKYTVFYCVLRYVGTAADMLAALEEVAFGKEPVPLDVLAEALKANFAGYEALRNRLLKAPKYGRDDDRADRHGVRMMKLMQDVVSRETVNPDTGKKDVYIWNVTITDMNHIRIGKELGATPDGRLAGTPVSENLSPTAGMTKSVTSLLNSVSKLPFDRVCSGALNARIAKGMVAGDAGLERLQALLEVYFRKGGMQFQLSATDTGELKEAQKYPELYKDLMVRITGYSAVFVDMSTRAQEEIIRRDEIIVPLP